MLNDKYVIEFAVVNYEFCLLMSKQRVNKILVSKIASRIKQLREDKGISQEMFYIDTDIHIGRIELGKSNITVSTLSEICDYFGISLVDFFRDI
jgi:hypothetical protein